MHLLIFVVSCLLVRWRYYSVSISKQSRVQLCLIFPGRHGKYMFIQERFYLQGIPNNINEQDTSFLDCKHKHMMKSGASPDKVRILHRLLPIELTSRIDFQGLSLFGSWSYLNLFRGGMGPFNIQSGGLYLSFRQVLIFRVGGLYLRFRT